MTKNPAGSAGLQMTGIDATTAVLFRRKKMIITLCGSARFEDLFKSWNERLSIHGHVVFSLAVYPSDKEGVKTWYTPAEKMTLDSVHKKKIDASEAIVVITGHGSRYIGESTASEIEHAQKTGKKIFYTDEMCPYRGCSDLLHKRPPCALCYE